MSNPTDRPPGSPRRLTRSTRNRMWAGVAGGIGEYFDVDPVLIRLIWVAATIATSGAAIALYIILWIVMPRDDQADPVRGVESWRDWSDEFRTETQRVAAEARRVADDFTGRGRPRETVGSTSAAERSSTAVAGEGVATEVGAATEKGSEPQATPPPYQSPGPAYDPYAPSPGWDPGWRHNGHEHHRQRTAGLILVILGLIFLASEVGVFSWIQWSVVWPLILVGIGVSLLLRRADWR